MMCISRNQLYIHACSTLCILGLLLSGCRTPSPTPDPISDHLAAAEAHLAAGEYTAAETSYKAALSIAPDREELPLRLAELYLLWGRPEEGLAALAGGQRNAAASPEGDIVTMRLLAAQGDWQKVINAAEAVIDRAPTELSAWRALVDAELALGACESAERALTRAGSALQPTATELDEIAKLLAGNYADISITSPFFVAGMGACTEDCDLQMGLRLVELQEWGIAACVLQRVVDQSEIASETASSTGTDRLGETHAWLGEALAQLGHSRQAEEQLRQAVALSPESPLGWLLLGKHSLVTNDLETARVALLNAHRLDPANPAPCLAIAELWAASGRYSEVDTWIEAALDRAPGEPEVWKSAARFYLVRDLAANATLSTITEQAQALTPDDAEVHLLIGWLKIKEHQPEAAVELLNRAIELAPDLAEAHYLRSLALEETGAAEEAAAALIRAADLGNPQALARQAKSLDQ